jgi:hypothetical protein
MPRPYAEEWTARRARTRKRDRMARHAFHDAFRGVGVMHFSGDDGVETDDFLPGDGDVSLR